jgi:diaminopimelate epimerase
MKFTKMHGLGNDYIYVNCFDQKIDDPAALAVELSNRHFSVGGDGLILICPSEIADARMRMFNSDGSESQMCGNGLRCVSKYVFDHKLAEPATTFSIPGQASFPHSLNIETGNGVLKVGIMTGDDGKAEQICVNMGRPILKGRRIPVDIDEDTVVNVDFQVDGFDSPMTCVSMGNPHAVFFCDDINDVELEKVGPLIENHPLFPERINAHFVKVVSPEEFIMSTWERGSGITLACGTGACACCVAAVLGGRCKRAVLAHLPGGDLTLNWSEEDDCVYMTGPATEVFEGDIRLF